MKIITVKLQDDHLERIAARREPLKGIVELIWNSLDADALKVSVDFDRNPLGGVSEIRVSDNGLGLHYEEAVEAFGKLGGSSKRFKDRTPAGRLLHGSLGRGRFMAFTIGDSITWQTAYYDEDIIQRYKIVGKREDIQRFELEDPKPLSSNGTGTSVAIRSSTNELPSFNLQKTKQALAAEFALYFRQYPDIRLFFDGELIRGIDIEDAVTEYPLDSIELEDGSIVESELTVVEWSIQVPRALFLCDLHGFTLEKNSVGIHAPGFSFTAYLRSAYLKKVHDETGGLLVNLDPNLQALAELARTRLRAHFRLRSAEELAKLVDSWKQQEIYPYKGKAKNPVENAERKVFDVVAINVVSNLTDFADTGAKNQRFTFALLKQALETSPTALRAILEDVIGLPVDKQEELAELLEHTSLEAIINASKIVADRLEILEGLELLLFDPNIKDSTLERKHLHKIVAENTWIFGEEFNLTVDNQSLNMVLRKHIEGMGKALLVDSPVTRENGRGGIVDLMLSRRVPQPKAEQREHLVIELKRPSVKIGDKETGQIQSYAYAIADDERFKDTDTKWIFWAISNKTSNAVHRLVNQKNRRPGMLYEGENIVIIIKTWGTILDESRARLNFFQERLEYQTDRSSVLEHLRRVYEQYIPSIVHEGMV